MLRRASSAAFRSLSAASRASALARQCRAAAAARPNCSSVAAARSCASADDSCASAERSSAAAAYACAPLTDSTAATARSSALCTQSSPCARSSRSKATRRSAAPRRWRAASARAAAAVAAALARRALRCLRDISSPRARARRDRWLSRRGRRRSGNSIPKTVLHSRRSCAPLPGRHHGRSDHDGSHRRCDCLPARPVSQSFRRQHSVVGFTPEASPEGYERVSTGPPAVGCGLKRRISVRPQISSTRCTAGGPGMITSCVPCSAPRLWALINT